MRSNSLLLLLSLVLCTTSRAFAQTPNSADVEFFEKSVRPLLHDNCQSCHGPTKQKGKLRLDSREAILRGGDTGPAVVPGHPERSLLIKAIGYGDDDLRMPPRSKLAPQQIATLTRWIERGLAWPETGKIATKVAASVFNLAERSQHWCWQPLSKVAPPVHSGDFANPIEAFLAVKQQAAGIRPARPADKRILLRRVTFDLTGLPPTPAEIAAFLADDRPGAFARVIDRLLASPHYGERWGRHWLDLVRYAETTGHEFDHDIPEAYRYRDYVIRAFNADLPFNQLVLEHVAGDLLADPRIDPIDGTNASIQATAFWFLGETKHSPVDVRADEAERIDNQIDVFSKAFLGVTVSCARCHDHKFDAITTADYYSLASYFQGAHQQMAFLDRPELGIATLTRFRRLNDRLEASSKSLWTQAATAPRSWPEGVTRFEDFSKPDFANWFVSGQAFGSGPTSEAACLLHAGRSPQMYLVPPGIAHSGLIGENLAGVLRSQTFTISNKYVWFHVGGSGGKISVIIDGYQQIQDPIYGGLRFGVNSGETRSWRAIDLSMWQGHRAYIELADDGPGYLAIAGVGFCDRPPAEAASVTSPTLPMAGDLLQGLAADKRAAEAAVPRPQRIPAMEAATPWTGRIYVRGNPNSFGAPVPERFMEVFGTANEARTKEGRLGLANKVLTSGNSLLTRVLVNRLWKEHFGEGIVRTPDNFGKLGELPTHPELLDFLAGEFVRRDWSIKQMHRLMVLSDAYQRADQPDPAVATKDPQNRLFSFQPTRRLEAECIRDAILSVSGRLDTRFYGPSVAPFLNEHMAGRGRPSSSGPLDGAGRRSIYLNVRRNFLSPLLLAFDYPVPFTTMGRRMTSNVPAQALILLNDPFVVGQAGLWADRALQNSASTTSDCIRQVYLEAFGRPPTSEEIAVAQSYLAENSPGQGETRQAWVDLCHVLLNVKEFIFVR
ncbi:PSD1 and planctomycete cytochrome C domain-containing protein [soil metagenome]